MPDDVCRDIEFVLVERIEEVLDAAIPRLTRETTGESRHVQTADVVTKMSAMQD